MTPNPGAGVAATRAALTAASVPLDPSAGVAAVHAALDEIDVGAVTGLDLERTLRETERAISRLGAVKLALIAAADRADLASRRGRADTTAWLAGATRADSVGAASQVGLATALHAGLPATNAALADGVVSLEHARIIATTAAQLPDALTPDQRARVETSLVHTARLVPPSKLRRAARRALAAAELTAAQVDAHEDALLRTEEERAWERTRLTLHDNGDGTTTGHFTVPTLAGSILRKLVQQLASPRRTNGSLASRACGGEHEGSGGAMGGVRAGAAAPSTNAPQLRGDWAQEYGHAFVALLEHLPTERLSGKVAATVVVTIDHDKLVAGVGAAHLDTGVDISASQARRLACNAGLLPAVLRGESQVLDLGRADRFFTEAQRTALATTYDECAAEGCDRPYAWSELHHEHAWSRSGLTDLANAVPLCGFHHRRAHDPTYDVTVRADHRGIKTVSYRRRD